MKSGSNTTFLVAVKAYVVVLVCLFCNTEVNPHVARVTRIENVTVQRSRIPETTRTILVDMFRLSDASPYTFKKK